MSGREKTRERWQEFPMLNPKIRKVTVNVSVGKSGEPLERAERVIEQLTGQKPVRRKAKKTIRDFGITKGEPISCVVTLRKERAHEFLSKALQAVDNKIPEENFDDKGNFSFGIREHIEIPGIKYVPELGILGMDISVSLGRAGYRVKERRKGKATIGKKHLLTSEEAIAYTEETLGVEVVKSVE